MNFQAGDRVSFVNAKMGGVVKRVIDRQQVLLLLDDGFEFPVNIQELVLVKKAESNEPPATVGGQEIILAEKEATQNKLFLGFTLETTKGDNREVRAYLINTFKNELLYTIYNSTTNLLKGVARGILEPSRANLVANFPLEQIESWRNWQIQVIAYQERPNEIILPQNFSAKLRPATLFQAKHMIPVLDRQGLNIELNANEVLESRTVTDSVPSDKIIADITPVQEIVDLHVDDLGDFASRLDAGSIMQMQLHHFQNALEKALASNMRRITFIHGVGNGKLKNELRKIAGFHRDVERFEEADPKKFGYGATTLYLKIR
jgi:hypothetical protein